MPRYLENERIIVTGATGYIGTALVRALRDLNDVDVLARDGSHAQAVLGLSPDRIHADLEAPGSVTALFGQIRPTVVFHLATHYEQLDDPAGVPTMIDANVRLGSVVLDAASRVPDCLVVAAGSHFQFAGREQRSANFYAATKSALCEIARYLQDARGLQWIQAVIFDTYGPSDTRPKLVTTLIDRVVSGEMVSLPDREPLHHFVYIDDVIAALVACVHDLRSPAATSGRSVFITSDDPVRPSTVLRTVASIVGIEPALAPEHYELAPGSIMVPTSGPRPLAWRPRIDLREGIEKVAAGRIDRTSESQVTK